jgi:hypothetical protein
MTEGDEETTAIEHCPLGRANEQANNCGGYLLYRERRPTDASRGAIGGQESAIGIKAPGSMCAAIV